MTHILVTGAAGLLGGAVCRRLQALDVPFTAVWHENEPPFAHRLRADLRVPGALDGLGAIDAVIHAAAALPASFDESADVAAINRAVDGAVLTAAEQRGARVVYASGTSLYAPTDGAALAETAPLAPRGPYLEQKAESEELGRAWSARTGLAFTSLRVSAPYGADQRARTVIRLFAERALAGGPLEYLGSGSREQDFTWADDAADAFVRAIDGPPGVFNVASGRSVTMRELAALVAEAAGLELSQVRANPRSDPNEGVLARYDVTAAHHALGWSARTTLRDGIERLLNA